MNRWILFAGLGMIRFGMELFEESLKKLGGSQLRVILQKYTDTSLKSTLIGTIVTGILNSSTLISLLTLGFVSAGMMQLRNAVGILVGANIGSTATGLIVGYLGFGEFKISMFALPLIAIGGAIMIVTSRKYRSYWARLLLGFGLFFLGIDFLKENVEVMSTIFNLEQYKDMSLWLFGVIGMIITAMIQSSGAVGVMTLAALSSGIITFEAGFAIILGANIGTTFTALIASLSGSVAKRQIGIANILFNIITVAIGIIAFPLFIWITLDVLGYRDNPVMGNAMINLVFNAITAIAFIPFIGGFTRLIQWIIPEKETVFPLKIIDLPLTTDTVSEQTFVALAALQEDKKTIFRQVLEHMASHWNLDSARIERGEAIESILKYRISIDSEDYEKRYQYCKDQFDLVLSYLQQLVMLAPEKERSEVLLLQQQYLALYSAFQASEDTRETIHMIVNSIEPSIKKLTQDIQTNVVELHRLFFSQLQQPSGTISQQLNEAILNWKSYHTDFLVQSTPHIIKGNLGDIDLSSLITVFAESDTAYKSLAQAIDS